MTYHDDEDSPPGSPPPKEQFGLNLGSLKGSYENRKKEYFSIETYSLSITNDG